MRNARAHLIFIVGIVLWGILPGTARADDAIEEKIDRLVVAKLPRDGPGCAVLVVDDGRIVFKRGYGIANMDTGLPITPATAFNIESVTKQFTAACIALLVEDGKIALDDDIRKYLPEMPQYEWPIQVQHLIYHTSGIRDFCLLSMLRGLSLDDPYPELESLDLLTRQKELNFRPGDMRRYSNSGYFLLGIIVKRVTGMTVGEYAAKHLFAPLGMTHTAYHYDPEKMGANLAVGHVSDGDGKYRRTRMVLDTNDLGHGGIYTTVEDLYRWDQSFYRNRIGSARFNALRLTRGVTNDGHTLSYAFGLYVGEHRGQRTVSHQGGSPGYNAFILRFPEPKFTVVCLANYALRTTELCYEIADLYLGLPEEPAASVATVPTATPPVADVDPAVYVGLVGKYVVDDGAIMIVSTKDNRLYIQPPDTGPLEFQPKSATEFVLKRAGVEVSFHQDESGRTSRLVWHQNGHHISARRVDSQSLSPDQLCEYEGRYYSEELKTTYGVYVNQDRLCLQAPRVPGAFQFNFSDPAGENVLKHVARDQFKRSYGTIVFSRDENGKVTGFAIHSGGDLRNLRFSKMH